jgi:mannose-6-phosphate isomerase class I
MALIHLAPRKPRSPEPEPAPGGMNEGATTMNMTDIPMGTTDWSKVERTEHEGESGLAYWQTQNFGDVRVRIVEYTPGYSADHWCQKGHIVFCLEGELHTELKDGRAFTLKPGMSYQVADNAEPHRSSTVSGVKLFIVD